jgi:hypothetical protein
VWVNLTGDTRRVSILISRDQANDQAMCVEPDFSPHRDQTLCGERDAGSVFVQLGAHWLIEASRNVRL